MVSWLVFCAVRKGCYAHKQNAALIGRKCVGIVAHCTHKHVCKRDFEDATVSLGMGGLSDPFGVAQSWLNFMPRGQNVPSSHNRHR